MRSRIRQAGNGSIVLGVMLLVVVFFNTTVNTPERWFFDGDISKGNLAIITIVLFGYLVIQGLVFRWIASSKED